MNKCFLRGALAGGMLLAIACGSDAVAQGHQSKSKANNKASHKTETITPANPAKTTGTDQLNPVVLPAAPGTYQILAKDAQSHEVFPVDILVEIEKNRHQTETVFLKAGQSSLIRILPFSQITARNFVPLPEYGVQE